MEKIKCLKITCGERWLAATPKIAMECLEMELAEDEVGSSYVVEVVEMTQEELDALPEFDGF